MFLYVLKKEGVYEPLSGPTEPITELSIRTMAGQMLADSNLIDLQVKYANMVRAIEAQVRAFGMGDAEIMIVSISNEHYRQMERELERTIVLMEESYKRVQNALDMVPGIDIGMVEREFLKACSFAGTQVLAEYETKDGKILVPVTQEEANAIREEYRETHCCYDEDGDYDDCDDCDECDDEYNDEDFCGFVSGKKCDHDCEGCPCRQCTDDCSSCEYCFEDKDEEEDEEDDEVFQRTKHSSKPTLPETCYGCWYHNETIGRCMHPGMRTVANKTECPFRTKRR